MSKPRTVTPGIAGEDPERGPAAGTDLGDVDAARQRRDELGVAREPLREEQLLVHRDVDALGGHPERRLELAGPDPAAVPDRAGHPRQQPAQRDEQLHDRADVEDHAAAQEPEGILDRRVSAVGDGRVAARDHGIGPACRVVGVDRRLSRQLGRAAAARQQRVRQAGLDPQRDRARGVPASDVGEQQRQVTHVHPSCGRQASSPAACAEDRAGEEGRVGRFYEPVKRDGMGCRHSPVRSSPRPSPPGGTGALRLSPWASHPGVSHAHARTGTAIRTLDWITSSLTDLQST